MRRAALVVAAAACAWPGMVVGQRLPAGLRAYVLEVGLAQDSSAAGSSSLSNITRVRLMAEPAVGPFVFDVAYEHVAIATGASGATAGTGLLVSGSAGEWVDLRWTVERTGHVQWVHGFDRLNARFSLGDAWDVRIGRQTISWATTLYLSPADPFVPFDPSDPFREYRGGVDAVRVQHFLGPFTSVDLVVRPAETALGETLTAAARVHTVWEGWDLGAWGGRVHDRAGFAASVTRTVAGAAVRGEAAVRDEPGGRVWRVAVGADRRFSVFGRDLYVVAEYQYDGFGASDPASLIAVATSDAARRGELQTLSRNTAAALGSLSWGGQWSVDLLGLHSLDDASTLVGPGAGYVISNALALRLGGYASFGTEFSAAGPGSAYGNVPLVGYASLSGFF